jgi:hypothetical protein
MRNLFLGAVLALLLAGCGSSKPAPPTLRQFAASANQICLHLSAQHAAIDARFAHVPVNSETEAALWHLTEQASREADQQVKALMRPPAQTSTIAKLVDGYYEEADFEHDIYMAYAGYQTDGAHVWRLMLMRQSISDAAIARSLGMNACVKAESAPVAQATAS